MSNRKLYLFMGIFAFIVVIIVLIIVVIKPRNRLEHNPNIGTAKSTATSEVGRYYENLGTVHYSFIPPEGWERSDQSNAYPYWENPDQSCVLFFQFLGAGTSAKDAAKKNMDQIIQSKSDSTFETLSEGALTTNEGIKGYKFQLEWTIKTSSDNNSQTFVGADYYFYQGGNIVMGHYACKPGNNAAIGKLLDGSVITFRFEK